MWSTLHRAQWQVSLSMLVMTDDLFAVIKTWSQSFDLLVYCWTDATCCYISLSLLVSACVLQRIPHVGKDPLLSCTGIWICLLAAVFLLIYFRCRPPHVILEPFTSFRSSLATKGESFTCGWVSGLLSVYLMPVVKHLLYHSKVQLKGSVKKKRSLYSSSMHLKAFMMLQNVPSILNKTFYFLFIKKSWEFPQKY